MPKVDHNDLAKIDPRYVAVLSTLNEKKCSLNNAYRLAGTACSLIRDFIGIAELKIVNEVIYHSTLERLGDPKLSVKEIEQQCRRQLSGLLPLVNRFRVGKKLFPLALDDAILYLYRIVIFFVVHSPDLYSFADNYNVHIHLYGRIFQLY